MPDGLITPGLVWQVWQAGEDYRVTPTEFSGLIETITSTVMWVFALGFLGMLIAAITKGLVERGNGKRINSI